MTTITQFIQPPTSLFTFQPTLDGQEYTAILSWLLYGQRYYINLYGVDGTLIFSQPLVGSPTGVSIDSLTWVNGTATAMTSDPHGYMIGDTIALTVSGCVPTTYNGVVLALITGPDTFTYQIASDPGLITTLGGASYDINLAGGYFLQSTLVFRDASQQFEVNP